MVCAYTGLGIHVYKDSRTRPRRAQSLSEQPSPCWPRLLSVLLSLIYVPPIICGGSKLVFCFVMHCFMSFLDFQSS